MANFSTKEIKVSEQLQKDGFTVVAVIGKGKDKTYVFNADESAINKHLGITPVYSGKK